MRLTRTEGMLSMGFGTGTNFFDLLGSRETFERGRNRSGPVIFHEGLRAFAGSDQERGKTRRARNGDSQHRSSDIVEFIECKIRIAKAQRYRGRGTTASIDGDAYASIFFQNATTRWRVTDDFMRAVVAEQGLVERRTCSTGSPTRRCWARDLMMKISIRRALRDPGLQYEPR